MYNFHLRGALLPGDIFRRGCHPCKNLKGIFSIIIIIIIIWRWCREEGGRRVFSVTVIGVHRTCPESLWYSP
ncbi:hypothetical protein GDO81_026665 [Engystomops pustulosus]|uniref:Uncharacterized protein n=1 Tax=Engystomops pustulosus TaxID=76066 RepID=A0AAV6YKX4_ENGPU|nr:hypothetical protein GDO81_026665 [Engystomops pustulosus]